MQRLGKTRYSLKQMRQMHFMLLAISFWGWVALVVSPLLAVLGFMEVVLFADATNEGKADMVRGLFGFTLGWVILWAVKKTRAWLEHKALTN